MNFDIQKSLREMAEEASSSVSFEQVWDQFKGNTKKKGHLPYQRLRRGIACVAASVLGIVGCGLGLSIVFPSVALAMDKTPIANQVYDWLGCY